jgi:hypothetical protein
MGRVVPLHSLRGLVEGKHNPTISYQESCIIYYSGKIISIELPCDPMVKVAVVLSGFAVWFSLRKKINGSALRECSNKKVF